MAESSHQGWRQVLFSKFGMVLLGFLAVAGYFLWAEHEAHIRAYLPLILVLGVCVGMHFFMHGGYGEGNNCRRGSNGGESEEGGR